MEQIVYIVFCVCCKCNALTEMGDKNEFGLHLKKKKNLVGPQLGPRAKQGPEEQVWAPRKNPINNRVKFGSWVQTRESGPGMQKFNPNLTRCHSYPQTAPIVGLKIQGPSPECMESWSNESNTMNL